MNRITVILLAALDAVIALGVGVAIPLVPLTIVWGLQFGTSVDWLPFWHAGADIWLLGHGVDVTLTMDPVISAAFGLSGTNVFTVSIAALGFALLTVIFGSHTGRRAWATPHPMTAAISGIAVFAALSTLVTLSAHTGPAVPSLLQGSLVPAVVFAIGLGIGFAAAELRDRADPARAEHPEPQRLPWPISRWTASTRAVLAAALRGGVAASALVIAASGVLFGVLLLVDYARVVGLYETLQPGLMGAIVLTLAQVALLPNAVIWTASWLAGPGFAIGTGSSVDVAQTSLGPLPNVPLLGALPQSDPFFGLAGVLVPVLCGLGAAYLTRRRIERMSAARSAASRPDRWGPGRLTIVVLGSAACTGIVLGLLAWWSSGAAGPGRLQHVGPNPLFVAGAVTAEVLVGGSIGIALRARSDREADAHAARPGLRERRRQDAFSSTDDLSALWAGLSAPVQRDEEPGSETRKNGSPAKGAASKNDQVTQPIPRQDKPRDRQSRPPVGHSTLARPNAPRVPSPKGRMPALRPHDEFGPPDFARHENADDDGRA